MIHCSCSDIENVKQQIMSSISRYRYIQYVHVLGIEWIFLVNVSKGDLRLIFYAKLKFEIHTFYMKEDFIDQPQVKIEKNTL